MARRQVDKYTDAGWVPTRMRFIRKGDIIRVGGSQVYVVDENPIWNSEDNNVALVVHKYNLTVDFEMSEDQRYVFIKD